MVKLSNRLKMSRGQTKALRKCRTMWIILVVSIQLLGCFGTVAGWQSAGSKSYNRGYGGNQPSEVPERVTSEDGNHGGGAQIPGAGGEPAATATGQTGFTPVMPLRKNFTTSVYSHASRYASYDGRDLRNGERSTSIPLTPGQPGYNASFPEGDPTGEGQQQDLCTEKGGCAYNGMDMEVLKSISLAKIRQDILRKLKLDENRLPNISGKNFPMADYLSEMVDMQGDSPRDDIDDEQATTQTIIAFSKIQQLKVTAKESREVYYFTFSDKLTNMRIENAILYIQVNITPQHQPYPGMHHRHHHVKKYTNFTIRIMQHIQQKKGESPIQIDYGYFKPEFRTTEDMHDTGAGHRHERTRWIMIDVRDEIGKWVSATPPSASKRIGLIIEAVSPDKEVSKEVKILGSGDLDILSASTVNNNPFIKLNLKEKTRSRHTRDVGMVCEENSPEKRCCRYPLTVDFEEFGWDFIIAPKRYDANYCSGECPPAFLQTYPHNHIVQQALPSGVGGPCCAARKLSAISMLYFDDNLNIIYSILPGMIVDRCGCT